MFQMNWKLIRVLIMRIFLLLQAQETVAKFRILVSLGKLAENLLKISDDLEAYTRSDDKSSTASSGPKPIKANHTNLSAQKSFKSKAIPSRRRQFFSGLCIFLVSPQSSSIFSSNKFQCKAQ